MEMLQLEAKKRDKVGKIATMQLRQDGYLPGVLYGHGAENLHLALPEAEMMAFFRGRGRILNLAVEGQSERAIVKDIQYDAMGNEIIHLDLLRIRLDEVISVSVPVKIVGTAPGVEEGGIQEVLRNEIQVKCLPTNIPESIEVDVSELGVQQALHLSDVTLPEGVELDDEPEYTVVSIVLKAAEPEPEPEAEEGEEGAAEGEEPKEGEEPAEGEKPDEGKDEKSE